MEPREKSDITSRFEYASTTNEKTSMLKKGVLTKHTQKEFIKKHGHPFDKEKCSEEENEDYNNLFKEAEGKYKQIA